MNCLNSRGCNDKDAVHLAFSHNGKYIDTDNFCSENCYLIYIGEREPSKKKYQVFQNLDRQIIHDIYFKYYCNGMPKKKPGVKPGTKRGIYKKPKIARLEKRQKEHDRKKKQRERIRKHRQRKKHSEIKRRQKFILKGV